MTKSDVKLVVEFNWLDGKFIESSLIAACHAACAL